MLLAYTNPEELKQLIAFYVGMCHGITARGARVNIALKGREARNRFIAILLRTATDLSRVSKREAARKVIAHLVMTMYQVMDESEASTIAFHVADTMQLEANFSFAKLTPEKAVESFCTALDTLQETQLLRVMRKIWV